MPHFKPNAPLLSRDDFRNGTFARDRFQCVVCGAPAVDAHHIIERRLFKATHEKGGYFLDNGASLCEKHHIEAEKTAISCQTIRQLCGIETVVLPEHFWPDLDYDKWGNVIAAEGRLKGELYYELSVQATLKDFNFLPYTVPPKSYHLPWSRAEAGDPVLEDDACFEREEVVATLKTAGLPYTGYNGYCHGQRPELALPTAVESFLLPRLAVLDTNMRVCGHYSDQHLHLSMVWVDNDCLDWMDTKDIAALLGLPLQVVLFDGIYDKNTVMKAFKSASHPEKKGFELRLKSGFRVFDVGKSIAKCVI